MNLLQRNEIEGGLTMGNDNLRSILVFLGIGLVAGFLASLVVGGGGLITYLVSGVIGSFVGGCLFRRSTSILASRAIWYARSSPRPSAPSLSSSLQG